MKNSITRFSGTIYPDLTFSIGRVPREKKKDDDKEYDREWDSQYYTAEYSEYKYGRVEEVNLRYFNEPTTPRRFIKTEQSSRNFRKYGLGGITGYGRKMLRSGAVLLEREYGNKRLGFITCTIPRYSKHNLKVIGANWNEIIRRFFQKVKRLQEKTKAPTDLVCCTEIQEKRYKKYGEIALHIHFVYICRANATDKKFTILAPQFRRMWKESVCQIISKYGKTEENNIDFSASVDCQIIKKSVSSYLGKYLSKGNKLFAEIDEEEYKDYIPSQWWTANKTLKDKIKKGVITLSSEDCIEYFYNQSQYYEAGIFTWFSYVTTEINNKEVIIGCTGRVTFECYQQWLSTKA